MSKDILKYTLTIPNELLEKVKKEAQTKGMSLNEYILLVLNQKLN